MDVARDAVSEVIAFAATESVLRLLQLPQETSSQGARGLTLAALVSISSLAPSDLQETPVSQMRIASNHLTNLRKLVHDGQNIDWATLMGLAEHAAGELADALGRSIRRRTVRKPAALGRASALRAVETYVTQDVRERHAMRTLVAIGAGSEIVAITLLVIGGTIQTIADRSVSVAMLAAAAVLAAITGAVAGWQAAKHRAFSREAQRLATQLQLIDPYLAQVADQAIRDTARVTMMQRMFPRLLEDVDPIREPRWPDLAPFAYAGEVGRESQQSDASPTVESDGEPISPPICESRE